MGHALFSPSGADRWTRCPASIAMTKDLPNQTSEASEEGTMLHDVMLQHVKDGKPLKDFDLTDEQRQACVDSAEWVKENMPGERFYETKVYFGDVVGQPQEESSGTVDIASFDGETLYVSDYKFGHNYVNPVENSQGILYSIGLIDLLESVGYNIKDVHFNIIQPRTGNQITNGEYVVSREELRNKAKEIAKACDEAKRSLTLKGKELEKVLVPGEKQCKYCKANYFCPALKKFATESVLALRDEFDVQDNVNLDKKTINENVQLMSDSKLGQALDMLPTLEILIDAVKKESLERALKGNNIPGYKLIEGRQGNRKWANEGTTASALINLGLHSDSIYNTKLVSPSEAEVLVAKALGISKAKAKDKIEEFVIRAEPKPSLVVAESRGGALWQPKVSLDEFEVIG